MQLSFDQARGDDIPLAISPARELGAYEALWDRPDTTFARLAKTFAKERGNTPSSFVSAEESKEYARRAFNAAREAGLDHLSVRIHGAGEYPMRLREASQPVELLYYQGTWALTETRCVAVVGTRKPSDEGRRRAQALTRKLVEHRFTVVSGLAAGIDTVAHQTVLAAGGRTIAVLGTSITTTYPKSNAALQREIAEKGLVISQVPIIRYARQSAAGNRFFFPERNITMSALTEATIIVEAGDTSGTLIQARHALSQGRKLFILESLFARKDLAWPRKFEAKGAVRVREFEQILEVLGGPAHQEGARNPAGCEGAS